MSSAIPYLHVRDVASFLRTILRSPDLPENNEVLIASPDIVVSHRELFEAATLFDRGHRSRPILVPKLLALPGMWGRDFLEEAACWASIHSSARGWPGTSTSR